MAKARRTNVAGMTGARIGPLRPEGNEAAQEGIGMPVDEPPWGPLATKDLRDTKRPILLWKPADLGTDVLDRHEHDEIPAGVGGHHLLLERAGLEELRHGGPAGRVEAASGRSAERLQQRVVARVVDPRQVSIDVAAHQRLVRF